MRSAYLCGARGVSHPKRSSVGVTGTVMKASASAATVCPLPAVNLAQAIRTIKEHNIFVYCADLGGAAGKTDLSARWRWSWAVRRRPALTRKLCDAAVTLEMAPGQVPALTATTSALRRASCAMMSCAAVLQRSKGNTA